MGVLDDMVALVTGASRGIGRGVAIALAGKGARVAVTSRTMTPGDAPVLDGDGRRVPGSLAETLEARTREIRLLKSSGRSSLDLPLSPGKLRGSAVARDGKV
jgi:NAD(P)-dependent dehydrogenase (short-subunit alcohol dehydrogenase family)